MTATRAKVLAVVCECRHGRARHVGRDAICTAGTCDCGHFAPMQTVSQGAAARPCGERPVVTQNLETRNQIATRRCSRCREEKPVDEFHRDIRARDGRTTTCKKCVAAKPQRQTFLHVVKTRARKRALAELAKRHAEEFRLLLWEHETKALQEAEQIAGNSEAQKLYGSEPIRLRRGIRAEGESVEDRIDVGRCPQCIRHHDAGHICASCGAAPPKPGTR